MSKKWERSANGRNLVLEGKGFALSYNPDTSFLGIFASDEGGSDETALIKEDTYYILNGDFREEYEAVFEQGFDACLAVFKAHPDKVSSWSTGSDE